MQPYTGDPQFVTKGGGRVKKMLCTIISGLTYWGMERALAAGMWILKKTGELKK